MKLFHAIATAAVMSFMVVFLSESQAKAQSTVQEAAQEFLSDKAYISQACANGRYINKYIGISNFLGNTWDPEYWSVTQGISMHQARILVYGQKLAYQIACPEVW